MAIDVSKVAMKKVVPPQQIKFVKGKTYLCVLIEVDKVRVNGGMVARFTVESPETGKKYRFLGTQQLNELIGIGDRGHLLQITYVGDDANVERNGNKMKVFEVMKSEHPVMPVVPVGQQMEDGTYISDGDVAF